jgi:hypothetical protein
MSESPARRRLPAVISAVVLAVASVLGMGTSLAAPVSVEVFGRLPALEDMVLSPDGSRVAFVETSGDKRSVLVFDLQNRDKPLGAFRVGDTKLRGVSWMDNDNLLITRSSTYQPKFGFGGKGRGSSWQHTESAPKNSWPSISKTASKRCSTHSRGSPSCAK